MTPINIYDWLTGPKGGYMTGPQNDMITRLYPTRVVMIKSKDKGYPTDTWAIQPGPDGKPSLGFFQTENGKIGWNSEKNFKLNNNRQPIWCPLTLTSLPWKSDTSYPLIDSYVNGVWDGKDSPLGPTYTEIGQPISIDWQGDVKRQDTLQIRYHWNQDREIYSLVRGFGLVEWQHASLDSTGLYKYIESALFNKFVALATLPDPVFGFPLTWLP